jgi:site-specific recombinase XerD
MKVHNPDKQLESALGNLQSSRITNKNKEHIKQFIDFLSAQGVGKLRQKKYICTMQNVAGWLQKDFPEVTKMDITNMIKNLENKIQKNGKAYSDWTKHDYKIITKKFYTWLRNKDTDDIDEWETPNEVKWIKATRPIDSNKIPSENVPTDS